MHLKPNHVAEFTKTLEERVLPMLRKQEGFKDEICFVSPDGLEAIAVSLWDRKSSAESYNGTAYPQVLQALTVFLEEKPQVKTYQVANSTFHEITSKTTV